MQEGGGAVCSITPNLLKGLLDLLYATHASPVTGSDAPSSQFPLLLEIGETINFALGGFIEYIDRVLMIVELCGAATIWSR